ncbi:hypothetical protein MPTK1_3g18140 [Marchantia polymorpha subsp. ruderalis]|uniref:Uncharacterized protein n=2 Tax=Marchantia polymorpha TaxID=3197 RepID=A0AAF6B237_MARPO|nr:hypothetical protein MARPO_0140s0027 [Marchantia polymorpha]BBN06071.1 hypothetical protein Mp_3g18140 [Marchantia polymorpha subsp. ruderalis]|eukprot:PTQ29497.1 hypothetical protein MARPO_0140s0027 [Marchantia polymorpha]
MTTAGATSSARPTSPYRTCRFTEASTPATDPKSHVKTSGDVENVLARSLRNENDLLRFQLNDIISREKNQRIELQRLRSHRDVEVSQLVSTATTQLKSEVDQLKGLLQSTSSQLLQALNDKEKLVSEKDQSVRVLEEVRHGAAASEASLRNRLQHFEDMVTKGFAMATTLADSVDAFQRHVLPTFNPSATGKETGESGAARSLTEELSRLENGLTLLRVLVDAKNDTLVLIRGKLKQENEELRAELQVARERDSKQTLAAQQPAQTNTEDVAFEKNMLRQELHSLQNLFNAEVKQLKAKLKMYELEDQAGHGRFEEVQKELLNLQNKLVAQEGSRALLESRLKEETSARSQLVSQLVTLRKENEKYKAELETLKLNQKFLLRQPRSGRIPVEKMDLMNTMNQLLMEMNKLKGDKVALEEELKVQRRSQVREHVKRTVTARDVNMAASNKVGDLELASKLATARLQQLEQGASRLSPNSAGTPLSLTDCNNDGSNGISSGMSMIHMI